MSQKNELNPILAIKEEDKITILNFFGPIAEKWYENDKCFDEQEVAKAFSAINPNKPLDIYINSPGGSVSSALAINGILSTHKAGITIHVTGLAASAATLITSLKNAKTVISRGSLFMIHNPMTNAYGNAEELEHQAEILDKCAESMRTIYKEKTGLEDKEIKYLMDAETWMTAEEAVEKGFADEIDNSEQVTAYMKDDHILAIAGMEWDLKNLRKPSKEMLMSKKTEDPMPAAKEDTQIVAKPEDEKMEALTVERFNAEHPALFKAIVAETIRVERNRIKSLLEIDNGANHDLVLKAMFDEPMSAEQVAIETIRIQKTQNDNQAKALTEDAQLLASDLAGADTAEGALRDSKESERNSLVAAVHSHLAKINGYK
ncbi:MAG: head maturation protease, ClpP-related [Succinivibrio sp.]